MSCAQPVDNRHILWISRATEGPGWYSGYMRFFGRGFGDRGDPDAAARHRLFVRMMEAKDFGDRRDVDRLLVEATRWMKAHPHDAVIHEARDQLRARFPPAR